MLERRLQWEDRRGQNNCTAEIIDDMSSLADTIINQDDIRDAISASVSLNLQLQTQAALNIYIQTWKVGQIRHRLGMSEFKL